MLCCQKTNYLRLENMSQQGGQEGLQAGAVEDSDDKENIEYGLLQTR